MTTLLQALEELKSLYPEVMIGEVGKKNFYDPLSVISIDEAIEAAHSFDEVIEKINYDESFSVEEMVGCHGLDHTRVNDLIVKFTEKYKFVIYMRDAAIENNHKIPFYVEDGWHYTRMMPCGLVLPEDESTTLEDAA